MKRITLTLMMITLLSSFSGCVKKEIRYIKVPCPKLQLIDKNISIPKPVKLEIVR